MGIFWLFTEHSFEFHIKFFDISRPNQLLLLKSDTAIQNNPHTDCASNCVEFTGVP